MSQDRPNPDIINKGNTSVSLSMIVPPLDEQCSDVVVSFPPVIFGINVEDTDHSISGFPIVSDNNYVNEIVPVDCFQFVLH